jgi:hypothetical protein
MNPWRGYLLLLQDFAQWTGTYGGMIRLDLHRDEIPTDGCCDHNVERHQRIAPGRKKDVSPETL